MHREDLGRLGEQAALTFLIDKGYSLLHRNWRHRKLELDLVCTHLNQLVIVEVKTRDSSHFGEPWQFLTLKQRQHLIRAADAYVQAHSIDLEVRFDVVSVVHNAHGTSLQHFPEAFYPML